MDVDLDDRITIVAPEGVELALMLAGLGSRFIAGSVDVFVQSVLLAVLALVTGAIGGSHTALLAIFLIGAFVIIFLYPILFELLRGGQTPGKRLSRLRVVRDSGAPVDLPASAIRNLMRLIDGPILLYVPTVLAIALTSRNQRPGDLAAGTLVIRESGVEEGRRRRRRAPDAHSASDALTATRGWDVSAVSAEEIAAVRRFLERREGLDREARRRLALQLAHGLRRKVAGAPSEVSAEQFLEELVRSKR